MGSMIGDGCTRACVYCMSFGIGRLPSLFGFFAYRLMPMQNRAGVRYLKVMGLWDLYLPRGNKLYGPSENVYIYLFMVGYIYKWLNLSLCSFC